MSIKSLTTLLVAALLIGGGMTGLSADAWAQAKSDAPKAKAAEKKAPGKACSDLTPNSQAHKDCIQKQAKSEKVKVTKPKKPTSPVAPKKTS